jgi:dipeptidase
VVQQQLEGKFVANQKNVDQAAVALYNKSPQLALDYLTNYSVEQAQSTVKRWKELGEFLIFKYLDGNVKDEHNQVTHPGYPESWYRRIVDENGEHFRVKEIKAE